MKFWFCRICHRLSRSLYRSCILDASLQEPFVSHASSGSLLGIQQGLSCYRFPESLALQNFKVLFNRRWRILEIVTVSSAARKTSAG